MNRVRRDRDEVYDEAVGAYGAALDRLARSCERDADKQRDLVQEIHLALWRSLEGFEGSCSLRTWVYRVAHNVAASHVIRESRDRSRRLVSLEDVEATLAHPTAHADVDRARQLDLLYELIRSLQPLDRQIVLLYLEGSEAASIAEVTGLSPGNAATRIHRIKRILSSRYHDKDTR
jgi:RNA polymerase sigma-70 factor, ECF subfamily